MQRAGMYGLPYCSGGGKTWPAFLYGIIAQNYFGALPAAADIVISSPLVSFFAGASQGNVNLKVEPWPGSDSTHIFPPQRSTIFLQIARPMPLPGYSVLVCRRWKTTKIFST